MRRGQVARVSFPPYIEYIVLVRTFFLVSRVFLFDSNLLPRYEIIIWTKRSEIPRLSFDRYFVMTQDLDRFPCPSDGFPFAVPPSPLKSAMGQPVEIYSDLLCNHNYIVFKTLRFSLILCILRRPYRIMLVNNPIITM